MSGSPKAVPSSINSWSAEYLEAQYRAYQADQTSVPADLVSFFQGFDLATARGVISGAVRGGSGDRAVGGEVGEALRFQAAVADLVESYRSLGHLASKIDPFDREPQRPGALTLEYYGLSTADLGRQVNSGTVSIPNTTTLGELVGFLERTYCGSIGMQTAHLTNAEERAWLLQRFEQHAGRVPLSRGDKAHILERLVRAEQFERFLQKRYQGEKRFSIEGGESLIPLLDSLIETGAGNDVEEIVIGMAHRGRLSVLNTILGKSYEQIFTEFEDSYSSMINGGGDVKYHRGYSGERTLRCGKTVHLAMASNPSHLESVGPVVQGRCRAKQRLRGDIERCRVLPVLIHGDAAIIGQGVVAETLNLSQLEGYTAGGTVHVVVNNLVGFTTGPQDARSSRYCTDVALMIEAPVMHVNGEDPEAVVACAQFAIEYRQKFKKDVLIDMYCYRKYGHNEQDEASFTQPEYTRLVQAAPGVLRRYSARLQEEGVLTQPDLVAIEKRLQDALEAAQAAAKKAPYDPTIDPGSKKWAGFMSEYSFKAVNTAVKRDMIQEVCAALGRVPDGFNTNPKLVKLLADRAALPKTEGQIGLSYADAESLAYGTLLLEGYAVRLSGQDCRRGTFSHRHAVLRDITTEERHTPLNSMRAVADGPLQLGKVGADGRPMQAKFCVYDSPLSEAAVMGFDYGYSLADPNMLILWEGQFGDFVNGAQTIIDQYLASAESKWERRSGLVLLLPHGYEGAGPEHSSARLERFLQLCGDDNLIVAYPTTAAQCFHMLRRQMKADFRKPLVVMTPKSMLRTLTSDIAELTTGKFQTLIDDPAFEKSGHDAKKVTRVLLCTGKIYHELAARREATGRFDTAIVRIEQLYPFDLTICKQILSKYPAGTRKFWVQEEPRNMGAFAFISDILREKLELNVTYIGRPASASPAVGSKSKHKYEQDSILAEGVAPLPKVSGPDASVAHVDKNGSHDNATKPIKKAKA